MNRRPVCDHLASALRWGGALIALSYSLLTTGCANALYRFGSDTPFGAYPYQCSAVMARDCARDISAIWSDKDPHSDLKLSEEDRRFDYSYGPIFFLLDEPWELVFDTLFLPLDLVGWCLGQHKRNQLENGYYR